MGFVLGPNGDEDGDGYTNKQEQELGFNLNLPEEVVNGGISVRNSTMLAYKADMDGDGLNDEVETVGFL